MALQEVFIEFVGHEVVVFRPSTTEVVIVKSAFEDALAFARAKWPDLGIRVIKSKDR